MYQVFLRDILLPCPPYEINVRVNGRSKTLDLINDGEINILKSKGLDDIEIKFMLPNMEYPFSMGVDKLTRANYYIRRFEKFKADKEVFSMVVLRYFPDNERIFSTEKRVTLENYEYVESGENGFDIEVKMQLKEYKEYGTKKMSIQKKENNVAYVSKTRSDTRNEAKNYVAKSGDTLWKIAKSLFDDGSKYEYLMKINNISDPNFLKVGQAIKLKE